MEGERSIYNREPMTSQLKEERKTCEVALEMGNIFYGQAEE